MSSNAAMNTRVYMAWVMPMSRTRPAFLENPLTSSLGCPNSFTSSAPATLKRSVMVLVIWALSVYDSRVMSARRRPTKRAGMRKTGRSASATRVIGHDSQNIAARVMATPITLLTTEENVSVKACWAPRTSLFSLDTRAPVWVRVKKAMGIFWMCSNTRVRMS